MLLDSLVRSTERYVGNHGSRVKEFALFFSSHVSEDELGVSVSTTAPAVMRPRAPCPVSRDAAALACAGRSDPAPRAGLPAEPGCVQEEKGIVQREHWYF